MAKLLYIMFAMLLASMKTDAAVHFDHEANAVDWTDGKVHNAPRGVNPINGLPVEGNPGNNLINGLPVSANPGNNPINGLPVPTGPKITSHVKKPGPQGIRKGHLHPTLSPLEPTEHETMHQTSDTTKPPAVTVTGPTQVTLEGKTYLFHSHFF